MATFWEIAVHSVDHLFSLYFDYFVILVIIYFVILVSFGFESWADFTLKSLLPVNW